jgi:pyruvate dehydrogenase E2 component (dihydrolipoamide acetyltransferase)
MATEVTLPALGESVTEGTVTRWLKQVGDSVSVDEALLEVSTDKVDTEIPSPVAGTLLEIKAGEDETVEVGAVLGLIGAEGEAAGGGQADDQSSGEAPPEDQAEDQAGGGQEQGDAQAEEQAQEQAQEQAESDTQEQQPEEPEEPSQPEQPAAQEQQQEQQGQPSGGEDTSGGGSGKTTSVTLPALGESVTEGTVTRWLKQVGDEVAVDEALLEVSTDKVDTEIPSPVAGTLLEIKVNEDETVEVGAELAVIGDKGAAPSGGGDEPPAEAQQEEPSAQEQQESEQEQPEQEQQSE